MINNYLKKRYLKIFYYSFINFYTNGSNFKLQFYKHEDYVVPKNLKVIFYNVKVLESLCLTISNIVTTTKIQKICKNEEYSKEYSKYYILYNIIILLIYFVSLGVYSLEYLVDLYSYVSTFIYSLMSVIVYFILFKYIEKDINKAIKEFEEIKKAFGDIVGNSTMQIKSINGISLSNIQKMKDEMKVIKKKFIIYTCLNFSILIFDFVISSMIRNIIAKQKPKQKSKPNYYMSL